MRNKEGTPEKGGTYLYFTRYDGKSIDEMEEEKTASAETTDSASGSAASPADGTKPAGADPTDNQTGTGTSTGVIAAIGVGAIALFFILFFVVYRTRNKRDEKAEK